MPFLSKIPQVERDLSVLERTGVSHVERCDVSGSLSAIASAVSQQHRTLPETLRRDVEHGIRREQRDRDRSRDSISIGDR